MKNSEPKSSTPEVNSATQQFAQRLKASAVNYEDKITSAKLAKQLNVKLEVLNEKLVSAGYLECAEDVYLLTLKGKDAGGEHKKSAKYGQYFLWPSNLPL